MRDGHHLQMDDDAITSSARLLRSFLRTPVVTCDCVPPERTNGSGTRAFLDIFLVGQTLRDKLLTHSSWPSICLKFSTFEIQQMTVGCPTGRAHEMRRRQTAEDGPDS